jgi:hypothetical protein
LFLGKKTAAGRAPVAARVLASSESGGRRHAILLKERSTLIKREIGALRGDD